MIALLTLFSVQALPNLATEPELIRLHREADRSLTAGEFTSAKKTFEEALLYDSESPSLHYGLACAEARVGNVAHALSSLARAIELGWHDEAVARWDEDLRALRAIPEFEVRLRRMRAEVKGRPSKDRLDFSLLHQGADAADELVVDPEGEFVVSAGRSGTLRVFRSADASLVRSLPGGLGEVWRLAISPDGTRLAGFGLRGSLRVWSLPDLERLAKLDAVPEFAAKRVAAFPHGLFLEFDPTSRALLLIPRDRTARLMSRDGELRTTFAEPLGSWRDSSVAWSADGQRFYSIDGKDIIERDTSRGEELRRFHSDSKLACLSISPQGDRLGTGNWELEVEIWDLGNGKVETFFESPTWEHGWWLGDDDDGFCDVRWSPNGKWIGCSTSEAAYVFVFNARSGELHWNGGFLGGRTGSPPVELHFAPSEDRLWYGYRIGIGSDVSLSQPMAQPEGILVGRGFATSARALGARSEGDGFTALDLDTGKSHWQRLDFGNGGHVVLVAAGWIDGEALDHRLVATRWLDGRTTEYYPILERFDPKRVRAGLAGIPLLEIAARE